jgi:NDP-sugar pyrophosphorylase family protein
MTVGAIMAGGEGNRLAVLGTPKPFIRVGERPLIGHVLWQLQMAGVGHTFIDVTSDDTTFKRRVDLYRPPNMSVEFLTGSASTGTAGAVRRLLHAVSGEACLLSTVDTVAPEMAYSRLRDYDQATNNTTALIILATTVIQDEMPIWVHVGSDGTTVTDFGKGITPAERCFGNVRYFSQEAADAFLSISSETSDRDTKVMRALVSTLPGRVQQLTIDPVFDIDTPEDLRLATAWWVSAHRKEGSA